MSNRLYRALVVDDEAIARKMLTFALEQEGFACDSANDGMQASSLISNQTYDLVVTDLRMPNKHGHSLVVDLLAEEVHPAVMVHTGVDEPRLTRDLMIRGVDDIVYKPTNYATFAVRAKTIVEKRHQSSSTQLAVPEDPRIQQALACDEDDIENVSHGELRERLAGVSAVPSLSNAALDVYRLATEEDTGVNEIVACIERDVSLAADVLCVGNSAQYNPSGKRNMELTEVVVRIGRLRLSEIALTASASRALTRLDLPWLDVDLERKRSLAAGIALDALVAQGRHPSIENGLFLSAVMSPLGRIVLATAYPERHQALTQECLRSGAALGPAEQMTFSKSHTEAMAELLTEWNISSNVTGPLEHVHHPFALLGMLPDEERTRVELVKLAILVGRIAVGSWQPWDTLDFPPSSVLRRLRIRSVIELIAFTRSKSGEIADVPGSRTRSFTNVESAADTQRIGYWSSFGKEFDLLAEMFHAVGVDLVSSNSGDLELVVANCLECERSEVAGQYVLRGDQKLCVITTENKRGQFGGYSCTLAMPTSFHRLYETVRGIGDDESTAVAFGMPAATAQLGAVCEQLPLGEIGPRVQNFVGDSAEVG